MTGKSRDAFRDDLFRLQFQASPIPTFIWRQRGNDFVLRDFNEAASECTDGRISGLKGAALSEISGNSSRIRADMLRCCEEKKTIRVESEHRLQILGEKKKHLVLCYAFIPPDMVILHAEDVSARKAAESLLKKREEELQMASRELREVNAALRLLLAQNKEEYREMERRVAANIEELVLPYIQRLAGTNLNKDQSVYLKVVETNLAELTEPFQHRLGGMHHGLSRREIEVANLVRMGHTSREIAQLLNISKRAVEFYRDSLREKLGLKKRKRNLRAYLLSL